MATTLSFESKQSSDHTVMQIKRELMGETRDHYDKTMNMSVLQQSYDGRLDMSRHLGTAPAPMNVGYNPYTEQYDQPIGNPHGHFTQQIYPQQREELQSPEKHHKEFNNYVLQNNITSPLQQNMASPLHKRELNTTESENGDSGPEVPFLKIKHSNGKLAIPDILRSDVTQNIDFMSLTAHQRAKREFVPENRKDQCYWTKRVKNNDSARRSRVKRKALEKIMETRLVELQQENCELRREMIALKQRFGILVGDELVSAEPICGDSVLNGSHSPPGKLSKDDELEQQSSASDDSRSLDDSRSSYNVRSASVLSQSLDPTNRDRTDSVGSSSSGSANRSPNSNSPSANWDYNYMRTDKSGALDLTSDFGTRSTYSRDFPSSVHVPNESDSLQYSEEKMDTNMRGFPLKCRWKFSSSAKSSMDSSASFPGA